MTQAATPRTPSAIRRWAARITLPLALTACVPSYARTLRVPFATDASGRHLVDVPLDGLRSRWDGLELAEARFYQGGRTPLPSRIVDQDGDGAADAVRLPLELGSLAWVLVVSPADAEPETTLPDLPHADAEAVIFDFDRARR